MISHELRTPLNVILGYSDLLLDETFGTLQPAQAEVVQGIHASGHGLLQLIRDVLDLSRLDSGRILLDMQTTSVPELMTELASGARALQSDGEVELAVEIDPRLGTLNTDPAKLTVALKNLLANAFKFTPSGRVTLAARAEGGGVEFVVADTGVGIPADHFELIFEPFRQGDAALTRRHGGVGLGLYVVRRMVEMLGGTVRVDSRPGHGSTFRVWLPNASDPGCPDGEHRPPAAEPPSTDAVTGLPSAALLRDRLARALHAGEPDHSAAVLLLVEIDSALVPARARAAGMDALLCMVGERLVSTLRMTDTVAHQDGGEFLVLLPGRSTDTAVDELAHLLRATLAVDFLVDGVPCRIGTTIGAVVVHGGGHSADEVVASARQAVRRAKSSGRGIAIVQG
jgi:diguanylate cyclase (GGDEF)-like protein